MPGGGGELRLKQRGEEFSIMAGKIELMNSRLSGSEEALATMAADKMREQKTPHMLIGGLGMGFTLRAALKRLPPTAKITVAELVPAVVAWAKGPLAGIFDNCLDDPRVTIHVGDVGDLIWSGKAKFDAILLDVDNGPEGLTRKANDDLYSFEGLAAARGALSPGGVLAVWSCWPDDNFTQRLKDSRFTVDKVQVRAHEGRSGARHVLWFATPGSGEAERSRPTKPKRR